MPHDPITFSVILSRFDAIATEMTVVLERSAWTSILALAHDFSCAIYDAVPRQISMFDALPIHTTSMHLVVEEIADASRADRGGGRLHVQRPLPQQHPHRRPRDGRAGVQRRASCVFWSVTKGHQLDTGAFVASSVTASAENVWQEGITIPPCRLVERGEMRQDLLDIFLANVRFQDLVEGDVRSMLGSIERGRQRLVELCDEYGTETVLGYVDEMIDYADRRMSQEIAAMPDGTYRAEGWVDSDGFDAEHIPVKVAVTIAGDRVTVDYTGSGPQGRGGANGTFATAMAAGTIPFLYYIDPDIPHNQGCIDHVEVIAPEGTICNARYPASTSCATIVPSDLMQDVVNRAMVAGDARPRARRRHALPEPRPVLGRGRARRRAVGLPADEQRRRRSARRSGHDALAAAASRQAALGGDEDRVDRAARAAVPGARRVMGGRAGLDGRRGVARRAGQPHRGAAARPAWPR